VERITKKETMPPLHIATNATKELEAHKMGAKAFSKTRFGRM
jgi:hypothetical protein